MREYVGHAPTKARTTITDDFASVILEDTLLLAERALVEQGDGDWWRELQGGGSLQLLKQTGSR